jgi:hypothetical protein
MPLKSMKFVLAQTLCMVSGCGHPYKSGAAIYSKEDGKLVGNLIEYKEHKFGNGLSAPAIHYRRPDGSDAWSSEDTFCASFVFEK